MFYWLALAETIKKYQVPYHRIFIMLFLELNAPDQILETINFQVYYICVALSGFEENNVEPVKMIDRLIIVLIIYYQRC
jgi:hypothetical protein